MSRRRLSIAAIGPGILVAATGVGAGDLLTASLAGSAVGLTILWAAAAGAVLKWFLNEGIARWQMATGTTLLEGWVRHLGPWIRWVFVIYLAIWSLLTGGAMINACGAAGAALLPVAEDLKTSKIFWGILHALAGLVLVRLGGFRLFERLMSACIAVMFVTVITTAVLMRPDWAAIGRGLIVPTIPAGETAWLLGVLGGVGGTLTLLSYGYWIREEGREGRSGLSACRLDLGVGYALTALFGASMIVIGSRVELHKGPGVVLDLAGQLEAAIGPAGRWVFLIGFWGAVFSSLLGVWQSAPYFFADFLSLRRERRADERRDLDFARTGAYRGYLTAMAVVPLPLLWLSLQRAQLVYAVLGSLFMPLLALTLLIMNNRTAWVGPAFRNRWITNAVLTLTLAFFATVGAAEILDIVSGWTAAR